MECIYIFTYPKTIHILGIQTSKSHRRIKLLRLMSDLLIIIKGSRTLIDKSEGVLYAFFEIILNKY